MIATNKLHGIIVENGYSKRRFADAIGMKPSTFCRKMQRGVFDSDEIELMIKRLNIQNPMEIFFADDVA